MPQVRVLSPRPLRVFISVMINTRFNLLLISLMVLDVENKVSTEVFSLSISLLEIIISLVELTGGVNMVSTNIVVGIGCYGGRPDNRVLVNKLKGIPLNEIEDKPSGFNSRTSTNCGFNRARSRKVFLLCGFFRDLSKEKHYG